MIGYSEHAKTRYHKVHRDHMWRTLHRPRRAACDLIRHIHFAYEDDREEELKVDAIGLHARPHLSRCPKCWAKGEK